VLDGNIERSDCTPRWIRDAKREQQHCKPSNRAQWSRRLIIMKFPDAQKARAWYASPKYHDVRKIRWACSTDNMSLFPGFDLKAALAMRGAAGK
jgi:hypothetical protein